MIDLYPFSGFTVAVLGLNDEGRTAATALRLSGATVWAWDDDEGRRKAAAAEGIPLKNLYECDWREPVSLVIEAAITHEGKDAHPIVALARQAGAEVIGDAELLIRAQRDAAYIGISGHHAPATVALLAYILQLSGQECEWTGGPAPADGRPRTALSLHPLDLGGTYILDMPASKLDITFSITFDVAVYAGGGGGGEKLKMLFHRQTDPRSAVVFADDDAGMALLAHLRAAGDQIIVPVSLRQAAEGGVYLKNDWLIDDREGKRIEVIDLGVSGRYDAPGRREAALLAYAAATAHGIAPPAVMACLNSYDFSAPDRGRLQA